jgi:hypothetical protein
MTYMGYSLLQQTVHRFRNATALNIRKIHVPCHPISGVLDACRDLFGQFDRRNPSQVELVRKLWRLRTHILFTLLPFDSTELALAEQLDAFRQAALCIPSLIDGATSLERSIHRLLSRPENPKSHWITDRLRGIGILDNKKIGLLVVMTGGGRAGVAATEVGASEIPSGITVIESRKQLLENVFDMLIIPGTCHYLSNRIHTEIFHMGRIREIEVLLYPGERFSLRDRLTPPDSSIFRGRLTKSRILLSSNDISALESADDQDTDREMSEALWDMSHDGQRSPTPNQVKSRYVLLMDGQGLFVPTENHLLVWRDDATEDEKYLASIAVDEVCEGDCVVMQPNDTGKLLDLVSARAGFDQKLEESCDWRPALERFLLTSSPEQLAAIMQADGARGLSLAQSIRNWANGSVYGPGSRNELRVLLSVLVRQGMLATPLDFDEFVENHWRTLQEVRGIRHRAGANLRQELTRQIADALKRHSSLSEGQILGLDNGISVRISQVAAVDDRCSWVPSSCVMQLRPMRGGRWQG